MRILFLLAFLLASMTLEAQSLTKVQNMGDRYRISAPSVPNPFVQFDTKRVRISVTCMATFATTVSYVSENGFVEFQMNGQQLVSSATEYLNKGIKVGQKSHGAVCFFGLNAINQCNKKL
jgi:hypothetical protein